MPVPYVRLLPIAGFEVWPSATWSPAWATAWPWWRSRGWPWSWRTPRASARAWRPCCTPWRPAAAGHPGPSWWACSSASRSGQCWSAPPPAGPWRSAEPAAIRRRLLADGAVGQLPDHVQVAGVAGVLLEHVEQGPGQGWTRVVRAEAPADRGLVVEPRAGDDPPRPGALVEEQRLDVVGALLGADPPRVAGAALHPG